MLNNIGLPGLVILGLLSGGGFGLVPMLTAATLLIIGTLPPVFSSALLQAVGM